MKIHNCEQKSAEWDLLRADKLTGTDADALTTPAKRATLMLSLLSAKLSNDPTDDESAMARGNRKEPEARELYSKITGNTIKQIGFAESDDGKVGDSPDGVVERDNKIVRVVEIKCLSSKNHLEIVLSGVIPKEHRQQCIHKFTVYEHCEAVDFFAFDDRISVKPYVLITLKREDIEDEIKEYKKKQEEFIEEFNQKLKQILL